MDPDVIREVDTTNLAGTLATNLAQLLSTSTIFSRCADYVRRGRGLENLGRGLSWQDPPNTFSSPQSISAENSSSHRDGRISSNESEMAMSIVKDEAPLLAPTPSQLCKPAAGLSLSIQGSGSTKAGSQSPSTSSEPTTIDSDSEDYVDESAIDDDYSDWEDVPDGMTFERVDSTANLTSRRSLITLALAQNDQSQSNSALRARAGSNDLDLRSPPKNGSPNDSDEAPLMMKGMRSSNLKPIRDVPCSGAQPLQAAPAYINIPAAHSPRTNRRTMLATELTDSLRQNMIWERQQKSRTANAVKRRHTSTDLVNL